jgi:hypothetical protein
VNPLRAIIDRHPPLAALRADLAGEIGVRRLTSDAQAALDWLTLVTARCYSLTCRGDTRYRTLLPAVTRMWHATERAVCREARNAALIVTSDAYSHSIKATAGGDVADILGVIGVTLGTIPRSIKRTSQAAALAQIEPYDYVGGVVDELLAGRWSQPQIAAPFAYLRRALLAEAERYYAAELRDRRRYVPLSVDIGYRPIQSVVVAADLERGMKILRAAGLPDDLARPIAERYLRYQGPGDTGVDSEIADALGWTPHRLERARDAMRRAWGGRVREWFEAGSYRPRKKSKNRPDSQGEKSPLGL